MTNNILYQYSFPEQNARQKPLLSNSCEILQYKLYHLVNSSHEN